MCYCRQVLQSTVKYPPWTFPNTSKSTETYFSPTSKDIANNITRLRTKRDVQQTLKLQIIINKSAWRRRHLHGWDPTLLQRVTWQLLLFSAFVSMDKSPRCGDMLVSFKAIFYIDCLALFLLICLTSVFKSIICRIC